MDISSLRIYFLLIVQGTS